MSKVTGQNIYVEFEEKLPKEAYVTTECTVVTTDGERIPVVFDGRDTEEDGKHFDFSLHGPMDNEVSLEDITDKLAGVEIAVYVEPEDVEAKAASISTTFDLDNGAVLGIPESKVSFPVFLYAEEREER